MHVYERLSESMEVWHEDGHVTYYIAKGIRPYDISIFSKEYPKCMQKDPESWAFLLAHIEKCLEGME